MPGYVVRHVAAGAVTGFRHSPTLQLAIDERVIIFAGISLRKRFAIVWSLLRGGMTIVEAP